MSTRNSACEHMRWNVIPGGVVQCRDCGDEVDVHELLAGDGEPVMLHADPQINHPKGLTFRLGDLHLSGGDPT